MNDDIAQMMPIKAVPFEHQKRAFAFAMKLFGVLKEGGSAYANGNDSLRYVREDVFKASDRDE